jgi:hypothetical protein
MKWHDSRKHRCVLVRRYKTDKDTSIVFASTQTCYVNLALGGEPPGLHGILRNAPAAVDRFVRRRRVRLAAMLGGLR